MKSIQQRASELTLDYFRMMVGYYGAHYKQAVKDGNTELAAYFRRMGKSHKRELDYLREKAQ